MQWKHTYQMFYDLLFRKMRKITNDAVKSFFNLDYFKRDNTRVEHLPGRVEMYLFWNRIATYWIRDWVVELIDWHHQTVTTKERLNWILQYMGKWFIYQKNYDWYWSDENNTVRPFGKWIAFSCLKKNDIWHT